jgi:hypothetical protein
MQFDEIRKKEKLLDEEKTVRYGRLRFCSIKLEIAYELNGGERWNYN